MLLRPCVASAKAVVAAAAGSLRPARGVAPRRPCRASGAARAYAIGSVLMKGRFSHRLPAATMQLMPFGVVLTTVQVSFSVDE